MTEINIKGAIFDLDGTLIDSMYIWETLGEDYIKSKGFIPSPDTARILKKMNIPEASKYFKKEYKFGISAKQINAEIDAMVEDFYFYTAPLKEGVISFLSSLAQNGIPMYIATATDRYLAERAIKRCNIDKFFRGMITSAEISSSKSKPDIFLYAAKKLGSETNGTVVFEDAFHAVKCAKDAGFNVIGIYDSSEDKNKEEIIKAANAFIYSFSEIICENGVLKFIYR